MGPKATGVVVLMCFALQGCQSAPRLSAEAMRAACLAREHLRVNGFFAEGSDRHRVTLTQSDGRLYAGDDGRVDYDRLLADRHGTLLAKLRGVRALPDKVRYNFFYDRRDGARCLTVSTYKWFAWFPEDNCAGEQPTAKLREQDLRCPT